MHLNPKKQFYLDKELFDNIAVEANHVWEAFLASFKDSNKDFDITKPLSPEMKDRLKNEFLDMGCPVMDFLQDFKCTECDNTHFAQIQVVLLYGEKVTYEGKNASHVAGCLKNVQLGLVNHHFSNVFIHLLDPFECLVIIRKTTMHDPNESELVLVEEKHLDDLCKNVKSVASVLKQNDNLH